MTVSEVITALSNAKIERINGFFSQSKEGEQFAKLRKVAAISEARLSNKNTTDIMAFHTQGNITSTKRQVIIELVKEYGAQEGVNVYTREHEDGSKYIGLTTEKRNWDNESIIHIVYKSK